MIIATGTLADLNVKLNATITELGAPVSPATGILTSVVAQLNALLNWKAAITPRATGTLANAVTTYNNFYYELGNKSIVKQVASLKPAASGNPNRITMALNGMTYTINQNTLNKFTTADEIKTACDKFLGYSPTDIWFHLNRNGRWAIATGPNAPTVWPEDEIPL
jgi:hypothetical protein